MVKANVQGKEEVENENLRLQQELNENETAILGLKKSNKNLYRDFLERRKEYEK